MSFLKIGDVLPNDLGAVFAGKSQKMPRARLTAEIDATEREIDATIYRLFDLADDEIELLEASLAGEYQLSRPL